MRLTWTRRRCWTVITATVTVLQVAGTAEAQYSPYGNQAQSPYASPTESQSNGVQQQSYSAQPSWQGYSAQQTPSYAAQQPSARYTAMASYGNQDAVPPPAPAPAPMPAPEYSSMPAQDYGYQGAPMGCYGGSTGCEYNYYNTFDAGCGYGCGGYHCGHNRCGGNYCMSGFGCGCGPRWFGGVYGLLMERSNSDCVPLGFVTADGQPEGYFPTDPEIIFYQHDALPEYQGGLEVRFGMYCGGRAGAGPMGQPYGGNCGGMNCDNCGGGGCGGCGPTHAWEVGYWNLFEEDATASIFDTTGDAFRTYGMVDFRGLQFDPGDGTFRDANVFFDYAPPTTDYTGILDVEVRQLSIRNTFSAQNLEINLMRLPMSFGGMSGGFGPRCEMTALLGFRIMRFDDDFAFRSDYEDMATNELGFLAYNVEVDNTLYGAQVGGSGTYRFGAGRFAVHCGTAVGLYGNHMEVTHWMDSPVGTATQFSSGTTEPFFVEGEDDHVSVVGELRLGASMMCHSNWRVYGGWRLLGISGVATSYDQIPGAFTTPQEVGLVDGEGSIILHGLQSGVEFVY